VAFDLNAEHSKNILAKFVSRFEILENQQFMVIEF